MAPKISEESARKLFLKNKLRPLEKFVNTQKPWRSECLKCGKTVSPNYSKVKARGHQCGYCAGSKVDPVDAVKLVKSRGFNPKTPYPGGNKKWAAICTTCKKELDIIYSNIKLGFGCKYCTGKEVHPDDAKDSIVRRGYEPLAPYPGASSPWKVRCSTCKREQKIKMHSLNSNKRCSYCAGYKLDISDINKRLEELDFQPLEKYQNARTPWKIKCLRCNHIIYPTWDRMNKANRNRGCGYCVRVRVDLKDVNKLMRQQGGWTETVDASEIDLPTIWAKVEELSKVKR
jgi:DNA-directed RNA polymerase subunit RPC12/RpoP